MKTFTIILSVSLVVLIGTTEAFSHPNRYYSVYGDQLTWDVPQSVLYRVNRAFYGYDLVHVRQVPYRGFVDFEFILENRGRFVAVSVDHYGRILRTTRIMNAPFAHHICDVYCGFHGDHYRRYYRTRPDGGRPGGGRPDGGHNPHNHYGKGNGKGHGHYKNNNWSDHDHDRRDDNRNEEYRGHDDDKRNTGRNGYRSGRADFDE